ncbi:hypothetical protein GRI97_06330 [Altererythrobacter xixiisoli]|uniref:Uncharacterized protein n=1 Tax=Croceibacterium xixiisoli TaxID=1476466 RepID=A0A6I4TW88_9SPHN|nr:hypothetical protein [Croceibacterium xixiisoli]MXO98603.1 hypothetical protein [Croceibacterium xixiisoli]
MRTQPVRRGLYRTVDPVLGECARTDPKSGDGYPFLIRSLYELLGFAPAFDQLPDQQEFERRQGAAASLNSRMAA